MTEFNPITRDYHQLRHALLHRQEVALVDVREEADYASGHPLFAVNIAFSKLDIEILNRIPRLTTPVTLYDNGSGLARAAALRLHQLGYQDIALLAGDLAGWREAGGELFIDVNSPGKAFWRAGRKPRRNPFTQCRRGRRTASQRQTGRGARRAPL